VSRGLRWLARLLRIASRCCGPLLDLVRLSLGSPCPDHHSFFFGFFVFLY
jgi:hypothetical protein